MIFLIATGNLHKKIEFERILLPLGIEIKTAKELGIDLPKIDESGATFEENAVLKAKSGAKISNLPTLADDSGICIDYLNNAPGIFSARYSSSIRDEVSDKENNEKVLSELLGVPLEKRNAHYVCAVACVFPDGREIITRGECHGHIGFEERGKNGFGYDPLFLVNVEEGAIPDIPIGKKTFGEYSSEAKDKVSHRSRALIKLYEALKDEI
ncbi:MAG: RdgB/HAM1 family non-canonical purine NTP pyrophosphatase [Ruminococcaceae bacterium]|nr:RdgB/HAM1 family non-canonical purine NTP pyrophosphatase [Oscillospiraceae bacterium]